MYTVSRELGSWPSQSDPGYSLHPISNPTHLALPPPLSSLDERGRRPLVPLDYLLSLAWTGYEAQSIDFANHARQQSTNRK